MNDQSVEQQSECDSAGMGSRQLLPDAVLGQWCQALAPMVDGPISNEVMDEDDNPSDQSSSYSGQGTSSSSMVRAARADVLSSSLVETMMEADRQSRKMMERPTVMPQSSSGSSSDGADKREECMGNLSNDSSANGSSTGPALVTGGTSTTTTSSSEYRYSVSSPLTTRNKQSLEDRSYRHHHHHSSRQNDQTHRSRPTYEAMHSLQVCTPLDHNPTNPASSTEDAAVIAHLPVPKMSTSGSSSFFSSSSENCGSGADETGSRHRRSSPLIAPHPEPGLHTIRRTLKKLTPMDVDNIEGQVMKKKSPHRSLKKMSYRQPHDPDAITKKKSSSSSSQRPGWRHMSHSHGSDNDSGQDSNGGESGGSSLESGTEGGYAGSASSNEQMAQCSCSSPSVSSDDTRDRHQKRSPHAYRRKLELTSSNIADFSSGDSESLTFASRFASTPSSSPSVSSDDDQEENHMGKDSTVTRKRRRSEPWNNSGRHFERNTLSSDAQHRTSDVTWGVAQGKVAQNRQFVSSRVAAMKDDTSASVKSPILLLGSDIMAHVLTFLEPPEVHDVLTMPLSKDWRTTFTLSEELWRVLCLLDPFKAKVDDDGNISDDSLDENLEDYNRHRIMYASFVRCMKYLARIKDDAIHGRTPSVQYTTSNGVARHHHIGENQNLKTFLAKARNIVGRNRQSSQNSSASSTNSVAGRRMEDKPIGVSDDGSSVESQEQALCARKRKTCSKKSPEKKVKFGFSKLTSRLLGPAATGEAGSHVELPWSCAIYSIVNWMVAFGDVEGIQVMCLKVLPFLLEDEQQRITAQRAGLTDIVLRDMVLFPESSQLNTAAFHTIVLLARPLGGREGMLFHSSMVHSSGIFNSGTQSGKNGIAVMLDSMRRFESDDVLQAMACWALVNIALVPSQKAMLVKLGGIEATANAMMQHPYSVEVQFRALFALINLVIPSVNLPDADEERRLQEQLGEVNDTSEKEMLDDCVAQITNLVVVAMKNFCSSEAILNRACLVLHNLSLTQDYHTTLLWTPNCYQMLEWCLANYRTDQVLQQSAAGTLHRLQVTLSHDEGLRTRFVAAIQAQQQLSLEHARQEARMLQEQQRMLNQR